MSFRSSEVYVVDLVIRNPASGSEANEMVFVSVERKQQTSASLRQVTIWSPSIIVIVARLLQPELTLHAASLWATGVWDLSIKMGKAAPELWRPHVKQEFNFVHHIYQEDPATLLLSTSTNLTYSKA
ncbi:hypothetical protein Moror_1714 [Moniliophthora roreri MCA 2997]|uniref:Uncharacterized protein n=1 Tax=Moniliophthora roreri (strain MCA 2997) TaxID=1381753 RepID=V2X2T4_MONRO|nr:hypothetical protein Moror_1714 [Moniliophthora roreri MCA 2997]